MRTTESGDSVDSVLFELLGSSITTSSNVTNLTTFVSCVEEMNGMEWNNSSAAKLIYEACNAVASAFFFHILGKF